MITIIDFEASGLEIPDSYPIEVGIAQIDEKRNIIEWSTLIYPEDSWTHWSEQAEDVHGIARSMLKENGLGVAQVARVLNLSLGDGIALCDGHRFDKHWADRLYAAAGIERTWKLGDYNLSYWGGEDLSLETMQEIARRQDGTKTPHRAGPDARILAELYLEIRDLIAADAA